jgi:hypothetical protein
MVREALRRSYRGACRHLEMVREAPSAKFFQPGSIRRRL